MRVDDYLSKELEEFNRVITSYSIHYTKLYDFSMIGGSVLLAILLRLFNLKDLYQIIRTE